MSGEGEEAGMAWELAHWDDEWGLEEVMKDLQDSPLAFLKPEPGEVDEEKLDGVTVETMSTATQEEEGSGSDVLNTREKLAIEARFALQVEQQRRWAERVEQEPKLVFPDPNLVVFLHRYASMLRGRIVLELGCGQGHNLGLFASLGFPFIALDFTEEAIAWAKRHHPCYWSYGAILEQDWRDPWPWIGEEDSSPLGLVVDIRGLTYGGKTVAARMIDRVYEALEPGGLYFGKFWGEKTNRPFGDLVPDKYDTGTLRRYFSRFKEMDLMSIQMHRVRTDQYEQEWVVIARK
jgi:SAM-dependent methyltransferase